MTWSVSFYGSPEIVAQELTDNIVQSQLALERVKRADPSHFLGVSVSGYAGGGAQDGSRTANAAFSFYSNPPEPPTPSPQDVAQKMKADALYGGAVAGGAGNLQAAPEVPPEAPPAEAAA